MEYNLKDYKNEYREKIKEAQSKRYGDAAVAELKRLEELRIEELRIMDEGYRTREGDYRYGWTEEQLKEDRRKWQYEGRKQDSPPYTYRPFKERYDHFIEVFQGVTSQNKRVESFGWNDEYLESWRTSPEIRRMVLSDPNLTDKTKIMILRDEDILGREFSPWSGDEEEYAKWKSLEKEADLDLAYAAREDHRKSMEAYYYRNYDEEKASNLYQEYLSKNMPNWFDGTMTTSTVEEFEEYYKMRKASEKETSKIINEPSGEDVPDSIMKSFEETDMFAPEIE